MTNVQISNRERALRDVGQHRGERLLTIGTVIFSIAFCALVFHAGWKEMLAGQGCGPSAASSCQIMAAQPTPHRAIISLLASHW
jgi:hypothetical protein